MKKFNEFNTSYVLGELESESIYLYTFTVIINSHVFFVRKSECKIQLCSHNLHIYSKLFSFLVQTTVSL